MRERGPGRNCVACGFAAVAERPDRTARGYRRFRCRDCGKQFNERSGGVLNHTQYPSDVIARVVLWRHCQPVRNRIEKLLLVLRNRTVHPSFITAIIYLATQSDGHSGVWSPT